MKLKTFEFIINRIFDRSPKIIDHENLYEINLFF